MTPARPSPLRRAALSAGLATTLSLAAPAVAAPAQLPGVAAGAAGSATQRGPRNPEAPGGYPIFKYSSRTPEGARGRFTLYYTIDGPSQVSGADVDTGAFIPLPGGGASGCQLTLGGGPGTYSSSNAPDYVETLACYLEFSLRALVGLGFNGGQVPPDIGRVFLVDYDEGGTSMPLNVPLLSGDILINVYREDDRLRILSTHELFHQFQYTYTTHLLPWWLLEGMAVWAEDLAFEEIDHYAVHVDHFLARPDMGLKAASYDAGLFWRYLTEQYGAQDPRYDMSVTFMDALWTHLGEGLGGIEAVDATLADLGEDATMAEVFTGGFALANALKDLPLGDPALTYVENDEAHFGEVAVYSGRDLSLGLGAPVAITGASLPEWGLHYHRLLPGAGVGAASVTVDADGPVTVHTAAVRPGGSAVTLSRGDGRTVRLDAGGMSGAAALWVIVATADQEANYALTVTGGAALP